MKNLLDNTSKALGVVTLGISIFISIKTARVDEKVENLSTNQKQLDYVQDSIEFDRTFKTQIYNDVKSAIASDNINLQRAAKEFVILMIDEQKFQISLLKVIQSATTSTELKNEISSNFSMQAENDKQDSVLQQHFVEKEILIAEKKLESNKLVDVEVFYCEETQTTSKPKAQRVHDLLASSNKYAVRSLRVLSQITNARPGYGIRSNVIRYNTNTGYNETEYANQIQQIITGNQIDMATLPTTYPTPWYISVFVYN